MFSFPTARRKPGWLALIPQGGGITLAHVVRRRDLRPEVCLLDRFSVETNELAALQRLRSARSLKSYACTTLMSDGEYNLTQVDAPPVPREERKEALRWAIKEMVSYPVDSACLDVLDVPNTGLPQGRSAGVMVVSAAEQSVRSRVAPFVAAKVPLAAVDIPELAQRNIAALFEDENRGLAFLRLDDNGMMLTLTFHGELIAVRRGEMNTQQLNSPDPEQRARVIERLVLEVQRSLDNFDRQYSHIPISKVVLACHPAVENLVNELVESIYVPVREMDLASVMDFPSIPELRNPLAQAKSLLALGAALRTDGDAA